MLTIISSTLAFCHLTWATSGVRHVGLKSFPLQSLISSFMELLRTLHISACLCLLFCYLCVWCVCQTDVFNIYPLHVCIYIIYVSVLMYMYMCVHLCIYACVHIFTYIFTYMCGDICQGMHEGVKGQLEVAIFLLFHMPSGIQFSASCSVARTSQLSHFRSPLILRGVWLLWLLGMSLSQNPAKPLLLVCRRGLSLSWELRHFPLCPPVYHLRLRCHVLVCGGTLSVTP